MREIIIVSSKQGDREKLLVTRITSSQVDWSPMQVTIRRALSMSYMEGYLTKIPKAKAHLRGLSYKVMRIERGPNNLLTTSPSMTFIEDDLAGVCLPYDDPMVVTLNIGGYDMAMILVDGGSVVDIIFNHAFKQMCISKGSLKFVDYPIIDFHRPPNQAQGANSVANPDRRRRKHLETDFLVVLGLQRNSGKTPNLSSRGSGLHIPSHYVVCLKSRDRREIKGKPTHG
ncbi:LOW QUALITY PROTEIN: hypothetical protein Cgig2_032666 [Carnegiea gigantea]|uniref:Uncharacterized protein n=1 Tax=Carnegiea gigantea TaxID=171969 RepID=A0A9Q1GMF7_9CARY|nr:LOW QUALITY PROTEIN: hypothetical protein Cgig2_032666 [Carnegiea gigantea]